MIADLEAELFRQPRERPLERGILEGDHATALPADRVVMVLAAGGDPLVAGDPARHLDALQEPEPFELLKRPVDARPTHGRSLAAHLLLELERRDGAVVAGERLDDRGAGAPAPVAGRAQGGEGVLGPGSVGRGRHQPIVAPASLGTRWERERDWPNGIETR